jgi:hypothetical protein
MGEMCGRALNIRVSAGLASAQAGLAEAIRL